MDHMKLTSSLDIGMDILVPCTRERFRAFLVPPVLVNLLYIERHDGVFWVPVHVDDMASPFPHLLWQLSDLR